MKVIPIVRLFILLMEKLFDSALVSFDKMNKFITAFRQFISYSFTVHLQQPKSVP